MPSYSPHDAFLLRLSHEEEREIAKLAKAGNKAAVSRLMEANLCYVAQIAKIYSRRRWDRYEDLFSEGSVGLVRALEKFEPDRGLRYVTYAAPWIKAYILAYLAFDEVVRRPRKKTEESARKGRRDASLNVQDSSEIEWVERLVSEDPSPEVQLLQHESRVTAKARVDTLLARLTDRERHVVVENIMIEEPRGLADIGREIGVTRERVRQIQEKAIDRMHPRRRRPVKLDAVAPPVTPSDDDPEETSTPLPEPDREAV